MLSSSRYFGTHHLSRRPNQHFQVDVDVVDADVVVVFVVVVVVVDSAVWVAQRKEVSLNEHEISHK